ncbi:MAG: hypothetical protein IPG87_12230 [Saprospiraceae bacterium]|nr:hypothetical protein [Candidatus Vicinibacter affinis]
MKRLLFNVLVGIFYWSVSCNAQWSSSMVLGMDFYQQYKNPEHVSDQGSSRSSGAAILAIPFGIQVSYGKNNVSIALEAGANFAPLAIDVNEFKGFGAVSFPLMAKFNAGALTGISKNRLIGYSIGGGIQFNRTELFGLNEKFKEIKRSIFPTYVGELGVGGGVGGFNLILFLRIGFNQANAFSLNTGIVTKTNLFKSKTANNNKTLHQS